MHSIDSRRLLQFLLLAVLVFGNAPPLAAQDATPANATDAATQPASDAPQAEVPIARRSARRTMLSFLTAMNEFAGGDEDALTNATACLDLSELDEIVRDELALDIAVDLKEAIDRIRYVSPLGFELSDNPTGDAVTWAEVDEVGRVVLARSDDGQWRFDPRTVANAAALFDAVAHKPRIAGREIEMLRFSSRWWRAQQPEMLRQRGFLLEHWQWLGLLAITFLGILADRLSVLLLRLAAGRAAKREHVALRGDTLRTALRPFGWLIMALVWQRLLLQLGLPPDAYLFLKVAAEFVVALAAVWGVYRLVDVLGEALKQWANGTDSTLDDLLVPLAIRTLKVFVFAMGIVFLADQLKLNVAGLLTGLGLGGLAFALAAQDLVKNLFGSVMVIADRTFQVGDWVVVDDVEGSIEDVGFRSTKIRTFYNSLITVPNSTFITASVDNLGQRRYRRWKTTLSLTYSTPPERIEAFCEGVRELVRRHPYTRKDYYQVYLNAYAAASLDVLVYVFFETPEWSTELRERERLMLDILRLAKRLGVDFAFPTQTLHLVQSDGSEPEPESEFAQSTAVNQAKLRARAAAREITSAFGLDGERPPPVRITVPSEENRGEG
ncbi:MAG: hypothetical protein DHS20C15_34060 [Planctomycetota bacterium]|nr:MAG: hypothetical protein DHS20C15_34060 [Planctomycetota bacterium]